MNWIFFKKKVVSLVHIYFRFALWLKKNSSNFVIQSEVKTKPIVTHSQHFHAPRQLRGLPLGFVIGHGDNTGFAVMTFN